MKQIQTYGGERYYPHSTLSVDRQISSLYDLADNTPHASVSVSGVFVVSRSDRFQESAHTRTHKQCEAPAGASLNLCASETLRLISSEPQHQSARGKLFRRRVTDR